MEILKKTAALAIALVLAGSLAAAEETQPAQPELPDDVKITDASQKHRGEAETFEEKMPEEHEKQEEADPEEEAVKAAQEVYPGYVFKVKKTTSLNGAEFYKLKGKSENGDKITVYVSADFEIVLSRKEYKALKKEAKKARESTQESRREEMNPPQMNPDGEWQPPMYGQPGHGNMPPMGMSGNGQPAPYEEEDLPDGISMPTMEMPEEQEDGDHQQEPNGMPQDGQPGMNDGDHQPVHDDMPQMEMPESEQPAPDYEEQQPDGISMPTMEMPQDGYPEPYFEGFPETEEAAAAETAENAETAEPDGCGTYVIVITDENGRETRITVNAASICILPAKD